MKHTSVRTETVRVPNDTVLFTIRSLAPLREREWDVLASGDWGKLEESRTYVVAGAWNTVVIA